MSSPTAPSIAEGAAAPVAADAADHLRRLEAEAVYVFREVAATFERPVLLFSGGKDSVVMLHLAAKAFWPAPIPFPVLHIDTGHNFDEVLAFRDTMAERMGLRLVVGSVQDDIDSGAVVEPTGPGATRNRLQTATLLRSIAEHGFDAAFGGARRDEDKARAKERIFSFRDRFGQWDPRAQRPELWNIFNGLHQKGEHIRVFPLSNWTELDIWQYIAAEGIELPSLYYAHVREVVEREGMLLSVGPLVRPLPGETPERRTVRFRTVGDATCTGAVESDATTPEAVVTEVAATRITERGATRADDRISEAGMEDRKKEGYATAGSVDDGKSTLIGRLSAVEATTRARGEEGVDLALLTDGLRAEREQGITIDVAHRYFATTARKFILADTPGHEQYTRNMVTGASTADVALILVDARHGLTRQSRRHTFLTSLLGVEHVVLCVNKMDLVDWDRGRFDAIRAEFAEFAAKLEVHDVEAIPVSALLGDNVTERSPNTPWYDGPSLLYHLENVHVVSDRNLIDARLPVQYVIRPRDSDFRGVAGTVASGAFAVGDEVVALPSGFTTTVTELYRPGGAKADRLEAGEAACVRLADQLDVGRGDMLCRPANRPQTATDLDVTLCWFSDTARLTAGTEYRMLHAHSSEPVRVEALDYRLDTSTLHRDQDAVELGLNDIGRVQLVARRPVLFDPYRRNRTTGSFVLVHPQTNETVAAGMISGPTLKASAVVWHGAAVTRAERATLGGTVWLTGLSASGKSTVACELERLLVARGIPAYRLDGDNLRHGLNADLGFSAADRAENVRRVGAVAQLLADAGTVAIASLISPYREDRDRIRAQHVQAGLPFVEVFVDTPVELCEQRDPKGMYAKARAGEIPEFTGVSAPYEEPERPELVLRPSDGEPAEQALVVLDRWLKLRS